ncbi:MAG: zinc ribbon domain-containing protein, partial [Candidatus Riflebacteria bacterium]|nr:zinc ribbon domain-containing protein [Candidatus Riflebacteria bacterium]
MLCPGCGFENDSDNKFCNMCGMALPNTEGSNDSPAEREPLDLDLSLDLNLDDSSTSNDLSLNLSDDTTNVAPADSADALNFDLSAAADNTNSLDLDLNAGASDFNFDTSDSSSNSLDLNLDKSSSEGIDLNLDLNANEEQPNTINIDTSVDSSDDPFAAPTEFDMSVNEANEEKTNELDFSATPEPEPVAETSTPIDDFSIDTDVTATNEQSSDFEATTTEVSNSDDLSTQDFTADTDSYNFGDLDTENVTDTNVVDAADDDLSGLIVSSNDDYSTSSDTDSSFNFTEETVDVSSDFDVPDETPATIETATENDDFMSSLVVEPVIEEEPVQTQAAKAPEKPKAAAKKEAAKTEDEDLNNLLLELGGAGFDNLDTPIEEELPQEENAAETEDMGYLSDIITPENKTAEAEAETFEVTDSHQEDSSIDFDKLEKDVSSGVSAGLNEAIALTQPQAMLEEVVPQTPEEQLEELRQL